MFRRDGKDIGRERVIDVRGALHHYEASSAILITTGNVLSGAREESSGTSSSPVRLVDGEALGNLCELYGVGLTRSCVDLPVLDAELFESLRSS